ncbi:tape measure protein [Dysosmobacter sp. Marseille-Q4140]|nr:tape measure protein [Dysosmobacter sp. Marseille-Q4140]
MANRKTDASIAFSVTDNLSQSVTRMRNNLDGFEQDVEGLQKQLDILQRTKVQLKNIDLKQAKSQVDEMRRALEELGDTATETERQTAQANFDAAVQNYNNVANQLDLVSRRARQTQKDLLNTTDAISKADNRASSVSSGGSMLAALGRAGLYSMLGDAAGQWASVLAGSALGSEGGSLFGGILSGAGSGAAIGSMIAPGVGTAVGAALGGVVGLASGASEVYGSRDEAFKSYVQDAVEGQLSEMDSIRSSGSVTAGQREQDQIAFTQRLGSDQAARDYLDQVREMATGTNYTYDEITGYSKSLLNTYNPEETFSVLQKLSDATAGLNLDSSGVEMFIAALSRMRTTGKLTQEYMNYFSERGLDADEAIARGLGIDKSRVREMATSGEIGGTEAAQAILDYIQEEFGGLSEKLASTYDAMVDNLGDAEANLNARMGEGYNEARKAGIEAQQDWLESDQLGEAYEAIGAWKAEMENAKEQYIRDAVNDAMGSEEYQAAQAEGDAAEMGRIIMQAKIHGMDEYNANEGKDEILAQELSLIQGVREDAALNESYWDAGYTLGQEFSKGRAAGMEEAPEGVPTSEYSTSQSSLLEDLENVENMRPHAAGLRRVPYDGYAALLHRDERVLTASQAREEDRGNSGSGIVIHVTGNTFGAGMDEEAVAEAIANAAARKLLAGFQS